MNTYEKIMCKVIDGMSILAVVVIWIGIFWFSINYLGWSSMRNYIEIPELRSIPEKSYSEDDVQLIVNNYYKATRERLNVILSDTKNYTKDQVEEILKLVWYAENNVKDEKSISDMYKV